MFKTFEQIDIRKMTVDELRELEKSNTAYIIYNNFNYKTGLFKKDSPYAPRFEECFGIVPLSFRVNDNKDDNEIKMFRDFIGKTSTVFRMEIA